MTAQSKATLVLAADNYLGETPLWSPQEHALYWVNCEQPYEVHRWHPETRKHDIWSMPNRVGGIVLKAGKRLGVVLWDGIYDFDPASGALELFVASPLPDHIALHETQVDRQGRLWVGAYDHHYKPGSTDARGGAFFRLDGKILTPVVEQISVANGLAFSPDGRTMYCCDAPTGVIDAFEIDPETGAASHHREFFRLNKGVDADGFADGATVDAEGGYWLAAVGAGTLRRYLPDGSLDRVVKLPVSNPTKPAFGGPDLKTLYVTTTQLQIGPDSQANGGLYALDVGVAGVAEPVWRQA